MKLFKPNWVNHEGQPIYSVDIHPDGSRLATSGLGDDNGKIVIWNMAPIVNQEQELNDSIPKILCQLEYHLGCVNVVRWSNDGKYLASGSDDKLIMIWQYSQMANYQNLENWKCAYTLRGHDGDVLDLSWSFRDQYLASCSVDNTIIIWNALQFPEMIKKINAHCGFVKGVTWDPIGKFLASQSDDKTLKIWRTNDWSVEKVIDEPFKQCGNTTHVLRLNWSPDGQLLISANAIKDGVPTGKIIQRKNWSTKFDVVGHRKAVTIVKFYPQILKSTPHDAEKVHCLYAVGSRDNSLSIWLTMYLRPITVLYDLFESQIVDITWSKEPISLLCSSMDGTVAYIEFENNEIGYPLTRIEHEKFYKIKYSFDLNSTIETKLSNNNQLNRCLNDNDNKKQSMQNFNKFIENVDVLLVQEQSHQQQQQQQQILTSKTAPLILLNESSSSNSQFKLNPSSNETHKQIERLLPNGRRRITPICIARSMEYETPKPFNSNHLNTPDIKLRSQTATEQSTIIVEKRNENDEIIDVSPIKSINYVKQGSSNSTNSNDTTQFNAPIVIQQPTAKQTPQKSSTLETTQNASNAVVNNEQTSQKTSKTITLTPLATNNQSTPKLQQQSSKIGANNEQTANQGNKVLNSKNLLNSSNNLKNQLINKATTQQKPVNAGSTPTVATTSTTSANTPSNNTQQQRKNVNTNTPLVNNSINQQKPQQQQSQQKQQIQQQQPQQFSKTDTNLNSTNDESLNRDRHRYSNGQSNRVQNAGSSSCLINLQPLRFDNKRTIKVINAKNKLNASIEIEIENYVYDNANLNQIKYVKDNKIKWKVEFLNEIYTLAYSKSMIACTCKDYDLYILNIEDGTQLCCPIVLDDHLVELKLNLNYLLAITCNGFLYVWYYDDYEHLVKIFINRQSCFSIFKEGQFINATITDNGIPVVNMSNNRSYFYSLNSQCWHMVPNLNNNLTVNSFIELNTNATMSNLQPIGPLSMIQLREHNDVLKSIEQLNVANKLRQDFTLKNLESQMNASIGLNSVKEYKFWLIVYVRYLCENLYEDKLKELCNFLLGPLYTTKWNPKIISLNKRDLLNEVLDVIGKNLNLQRFYTSYKQQLNIINNKTTTKNYNISVSNSIVNGISNSNSNSSEVVTHCNDINAFNANTNEVQKSSKNETTFKDSTISNMKHLFANLDKFESKLNGHAKEPMELEPIEKTSITAILSTSSSPPLTTTTTTTTTTATVPLTSPSPPPVPLPITETVDINDLVNNEINEIINDIVVDNVDKDIIISIENQIEEAIVITKNNENVSTTTTTSPKNNTETGEIININESNLEEIKAVNNENMQTD